MRRYHSYFIACLIVFFLTTVIAPPRCVGVNVGREIAAFSTNDFVAEDALMTAVQGLVEWTPQTDVPADKAWHITFSLPLEVSSILGKIVVTDGEGSRVNTSLYYNRALARVTVQSETPYMLGNEYVLHVLPGLRAENGTLLKKGVEMPFLIEQDETSFIPPPVGQAEFIFSGIEVGDSHSKVMQSLGTPPEELASVYSFTWYIYSGNYCNYLQVGIQNGQVVAFYSSSEGWRSRSGVQVGNSRSSVRAALGEPLQRIQRGNMFYTLPRNGEYEVFLVDDCYVTVFYDLHEGATVAGVQVIAEAIERAAGHPQGSPALVYGLERQVFHLANAARVRFGLTPFAWDKLATRASRKHSEDMAASGFFSHYNPRGESPFARMTREGISYLSAGENIAGGQSSAIFAHAGWMNSAGHRRNILGFFQRLGTGVAFGGPYRIYYTQKFYSPRQ